jgi:hypothetical protein
MKKARTIISLFAITFLSACNQHIYGPALYKSDIHYQFKPMSSDSIKTANYVSAGIGIGSGVNLQDEIVLGEAGYCRANTFEHFNLSYGGSAFLGDYQNHTIQPGETEYFTDKLLAGIGLRGSADVYVNTGRTDIRFGIEAAYSNEFGPYANFRKDVQKNSDYYTDAGTSLFTSGLTSEVIWHNKKERSTHYGYRLFVGSVFGSHQFTNNYVGTNPYTPYSPYQNENKLCISQAYFMQVDKINFVIESPNFMSLNLRLGYRF